MLENHMVFVVVREGYDISQWLAKLVYDVATYKFTCRYNFMGVNVYLVY